MEGLRVRKISSYRTTFPCCRMSIHPPFSVTFSLFIYLKKKVILIGIYRRVSFPIEKKWSVPLLIIRSIHPEVYLEKGILKICCKFTGEYPCRSVISISNFIEIALRRWCSAVNLLHIFRTPLSRPLLDGCF